MSNAFQWIANNGAALTVLVGVCANLCTRLAASDVWAPFSAKSPRLAAVVRLVAWVFPDIIAASREIGHITKGTVPPPPLPSIPPPPRTMQEPENDTH